MDRERYGDKYLLVDSESVVLVDGTIPYYDYWTLVCESADNRSVNEFMSNSKLWVSYAHLDVKTPTKDLIVIVCLVRRCCWSFVSDMIIGEAKKDGNFMGVKLLRRGGEYYLYNKWATNGSYVCLANKRPDVMTAYDVDKDKPKLDGQLTRKRKLDLEISGDGLLDKFPQIDLDKLAGEFQIVNCAELDAKKLTKNQYKKMAVHLLKNLNTQH